MFEKIRFSGSFLRFLTSGAFNTSVSYGVYLVLLGFLPYQWAYSVAYASGVALAYVLYRYYVFRASGGRFGLVLVVFIYLLQYFLGFALVLLWGHWLRFPIIFAPAFAVVLSIPLTYFLNRSIFSHMAYKNTPNKHHE